MALSAQLAFYSIAAALGVVIFLLGVPPGTGCLMYLGLVLMIICGFVAVDIFDQKRLNRDETLSNDKDR